MAVLTQIKEDIINKLLTLQVCRPNSTKTQWVVRCPYCGDSIHASHSHFSIKIDLDTNEAIVYRCLRCNEGGLFTSQTLEDLNIFDAKLEKSLENFNLLAPKTSSKKTKNKNYIIPFPKDTLSNKQKLNYINSRLNSNIEFNNCEEFGIILNLTEFLQCNNISIKDDSMGLDIKPYTIKELNKNYVGFISSNKNKITFRDVSGNGYFGRYYKLTFDLYYNSLNNFYSLKNSFELMYTEDIHVHIAEGTFDILSIYLNLYNSPNSHNNLFFASCGFNYTTILKYLVLMGVTTNIILHVYSDNDKTDYDLLKTFNNLFADVWIDTIIVHRNMYIGEKGQEKDFGVPMSRIKDESYKLKTL